MNLTITNALFTTLKINNVNVKNLLQIRFSNLIRSKHVEDLINKMDYILKEFEENMNLILNNWGYTVSIIDLPKIAVIDKADPINPIKNKIKNILNNNLDDNNDKLFSKIQNLSIPIVDNGNFKLNKNNLIRLIQTFVNQYRSYLSLFDKFNIKLIINNSMEEIFYFECHNNVVTSSELQPDLIHLTIKFKDQHHLEQFLSTKDLKYLSYELH